MTTGKKEVFLKTILILILQLFLYSCGTSTPKNTVIVPEPQNINNVHKEVVVQLSMMVYPTNSIKPVQKEVNPKELLKAANEYINELGISNIRFRSDNNLDNSQTVFVKINVEGIEKKKTVLRKAWFAATMLTVGLIPYCDDVTIKVRYELGREPKAKEVVFIDDFTTSECMAIYPIPISTESSFALMSSSAFYVHLNSTSRRLVQLVVERF